MKINSLFDDLSPSSTLYINERVNELWRQGKQVLHLGFGESRFRVHDKIAEALAAHAGQKSYLPAAGLPELRDAVAGYYRHQLNIDVDSSQVIIGPGSKALIYAIQMALEADLFLPTPSWVSYAPQAQLLGRRVRYIPARAEDDYNFDIAAFDALIEESDNPQKLLILNSPNNPTGRMFSNETLRHIADYCRERRIGVISDEIYSRVLHGDTPHHSIAAHHPEGTMVLGGLSKHLSVGGWRLGIALLPNTDAGKKLMSVLRVIASETWSSVASPIQYAALTAYSGDPELEQYVADCGRIHGIRTRFLHQKLTELGVRCAAPQGAFYLTANFDRWTPQLAAKSIHTSLDLAKYLLAEHSLATLSADSFGVPDTELSLRLATSYLDMERDADSDRLLERYRNGATSEQFMQPDVHPHTHMAADAFASFLESL